MKETNSSSELSSELISALDETDKSFSINQIKLQLDAMNPSEIAHAIESSPPYQRKLISVSYTHLTLPTKRIV